MPDVYLAALILYVSVGIALGLFLYNTMKHGIRKTVRRRLVFLCLSMPIMWLGFAFVAMAWQAAPGAALTEEFLLRGRDSDR